MKLQELLRENTDDVFYCSKRSEIARAVASMSMASTIDFAIEYESQDHLTRTMDQVDEDYDAIRTIIRKHTKHRVSSLGSGFLSSTFDHRKQREQLKACLDDLAAYFDPKSKDTKWSWKVSLQDEAWMTS